MYEMNSFIGLNTYGGHISITGSTFTNMNSCGSLIRKKTAFLFNPDNFATLTPKTALNDNYNYRANYYNYYLNN